MGPIVYINPDNIQSVLNAMCIEIGERLFFNIKIGNKAGWEIRYSLDSRTFKPKKDEILPLRGNSYILKPILKNKETIKDKHNNVYYTISKNNSNDVKNDSYVFWDTLLLDNEFKIVSSKNSTILGKGKRLIEDKEYISLVIEVFENGSLVVKDNSKTYKIEINNGKILIKES